MGDSTGPELSCQPMTGASTDIFIRIVDPCDLESANDPFEQLNKLKKVKRPELENIFAETKWLDSKFDGWPYPIPTGERKVSGFGLSVANPAKDSAGMIVLKKAIALQRLLECEIRSIKKQRKWNFYAYPQKIKFSELEAGGDKVDIMEIEFLHFGKLVIPGSENIEGV